MRSRSVTETRIQYMHHNTHTHIVTSAHTHSHSGLQQYYPPICLTCSISKESLTIDHNLFGSIIRKVPLAIHVVLLPTAFGATTRKREKQRRENSQKCVYTCVCVCVCVVCVCVQTRVRGTTNHKGQLFQYE